MDLASYYNTVFFQSVPQHLEQQQHQYSDPSSCQSYYTNNTTTYREEYGLTTGCSLGSSVGQPSPGGPAAPSSDYSSASSTTASPPPFSPYSNATTTTTHSYLEDFAAKNTHHVEYNNQLVASAEIRMSSGHSESGHNEEEEESLAGSYNRKRARELTRLPRIPPLEILQKRRLAANARERKRMNKINTAFERLKRVLPGLENKELSKFESLQLAQDYILHLAQILQTNSV